MAECTGTPKRRTPRKGNSAGPTRRRTPKAPTSSNNEINNPSDNPAPRYTDLNDIIRSRYTAREINAFVSQLRALPPQKDSRYIAYMRAGMVGSMSDCDQLSEWPPVVEALAQWHSDEFVLTKEELKGFSVLSEQKIRLIEAGISKGMVQKNVLHMAHVSSTIFTKWLEQGQLDIVNGKFGTPYAKVYYRIHKARPVGEFNLLECIHDAAFGNTDTETKNKVVRGPGVPVQEQIIVRKRQWQAAAWILERTRRETYGKDVKDKNEEESPQEEAQEIFDCLDLLINNKLEGLPDDPIIPEDDEGDQEYEG